MGLSSDLISQFVKATNDKEEVKKESILYGTTVEHEGTTYVKIDGSDLLTPIATTADTLPGERVTVMIKNHTATVTGNLSSPAARSDDIKEIAEAAKKITEFEIIIADKVDTEALNAEKARIDALVADNVTIKQTLVAAEGDIDRLQASTLNVTEKLTAAEGNITKLYTEKLDVTAANAKYATIENLEATNADLYDLESTYAEFVVTTTNKLTANDASIRDLETKKLSSDQADLKYATIAALNTEKARIDDLEAEVADIDTLIFGSATGSVIHSSFSNAVIAQLGDAQIKSAMIESIAADKITSGDIITNNVRVMSEDGSLIISDETIQIKDEERVRVQIGKDAAGDYSINIWDADGNLMFSEGGITDNAIKNAIIRNDMVSDTANIAAHKLDIDSLFEEINGSEKTIKSSRVYLDEQGQKLDVAFKTLTTDVEELQNGVSSQGTQITAIQGQIASKIWKNDIETAVNEVGAETENLSTQYEELQQDVTSMTATVANHTSEIAKKADNTTVTEVNNKVTSLETNLSGFQTTVSNTYATKNDVNNIEIGGRNLLLNTGNNNLPVMSNGANMVANGTDSVNSVNGITTMICNTSSREIYYRFMTPTESSSNLYGLEIGKSYTFSGKVQVTTTSGTLNRFATRIQTYNPSTAWAEFINETIISTDTSDWVDFSSTFTVPESIDGIYISFQLYYTDSWVGNILFKNLQLEKGTLATDWTPAPEDLEDRVSVTETKILQTEESITSLAGRTTTVENKFAGYSTKEETNSAITQSANSITSSVSQTYTTKTEFKSLGVGGRNLVAGTDKYREYNGNASDSSTNYKDVWSGKTIDIADGTEYVVSFDAKADVEQTIRCHFYSPNTTTSSTSSTGQHNTGADGSCDVTITTEWARYWVKWTQTPAETQKNIIVGRTFEDTDIYIRAVKFEAGNVPTDWSPAPEDMATSDDLATIQSTSEMVETRVTTAETLIEQLTDCISMLVTDGNGESLMTQTANGWTFSTKEIQDIVDTTSENLNTLTNDVGDIDSAVGVLQQAVSDLGVLSEYIKIGTYEGEPCIELGETDSDFKLLITNTRILFMEGTGVPAYLNNQSLFINKAVVEEELQQGEFVWKVRSNGNLGLIWKGATS